MVTSQVRALVGARVSHMGGDDKTSHITQRGKGESYAESQGWTVVGAFEDLDVSAIKLSPWDRPDLKQWLTDKAGDWDALIFAKTDRVFRSAFDCVELSKWCQTHKKILVLIDDGIKLDFYNPEDSKDAFASAMSKVFLILASVFAEIEGQRFVQRAHDRVSFLKTADRWGYGMPPFGYQVVDHPTGSGKALGFDLEAQAVVQDIASRLLAGSSLVRIANELNDDNVLSPADWARVRSGKEPRGAKWHPDRIRQILSSPTTQGLKVYKGRVSLNPAGEPVVVGPPSFDADTWAQVQVELEKRTHEPRARRHSLNPLLGVAKCAVCGKNMRQQTNARDGEATYRYYFCSNMPNPCKKVAILAETAEEQVEYKFLSTHRDRRVKERVWRVGSDHSAELEQTTRTIESLREDRALGLFTSEADQEMYRSQMAALVAKRDDLAKTPVVRSGWVELETDRTYGDVWETATMEERRTMLVDAGVRIWVSRMNDYDVETDLDRLLGEGEGGEEHLASTLLAKHGLT